MRNMSRQNTLTERHRKESAKGMQMKGLTGRQTESVSVVALHGCQ